MSNIKCPKCQGRGGIEIKEHRRFFQCYGECHYRDYARIALQLDQKNRSEDFFKMFEAEVASIGTNLELL